MWSFIRTVIHGSKKATKLGFPTLNFRSMRISKSVGVYASECMIERKKFQSISYFGPKTHYRGNTLETFIFDPLFRTQSLYGQKIKVKMLKLLRKPLHFSSEEMLRKTIFSDIQNAKHYFQQYASKNS